MQAKLLQSLLLGLKLLHGLPRMLLPSATEKSPVFLTARRNARPQRAGLLIGAAQDRDIALDKDCSGCCSLKADKGRAHSHMAERCLSA